MSTDAITAGTGTAARRIAAIPVPLPGPGISIPFAPDIDDFMPFEFAKKTIFDGDDWSIRDTSVDIDGAAARALAAYDRNNDGVIELARSSQDGSALMTMLGETTRFTGQGSASIRKLAEYADSLGNKDGKVTVEELSAAIAKFDQGTEGDGRLSGQERETFLEVFGETENKLRTRHLPAPPVRQEHSISGLRELDVRPRYVRQAKEL